VSRTVLIARVSAGILREVARPTLYVDAPLLWAQAECLKRSLLTQPLCLVDELVASVVSGARVALGVLVCQRVSRGRVSRDQDVLCMTLPSASSTACDVKFSEGMRLMKCFWRFFSCSEGPCQPGMLLARALVVPTFSMMLYTVGSACSRSWESTWGLVSKYSPKICPKGAPFAVRPWLLRRPAIVSAVFWRGSWRLRHRNWAPSGAKARCTRF